MIRLDNPIEYATSDCTFCLDFSRMHQISVHLYDKKGRKASLMITNYMLKPSFVTIDELKEHIYKQVIYEGSFKRQMLRLEQDIIVMMFTYPRCRVKTLSFSIEWKQPQQPTKNIECTAKCVEQIMKNAEIRLRSLASMLEARMDAKIASIISRLDRKFKEISKRLDNQLQQKISMVNARIQQYQNRNQNIAQRYLQESCRKLIDSNLRYFDEFRLIKTDLETSIMDCDLNIKELSHQVSDIRAFVLKSQQKTGEQIHKRSKDRLSYSSQQQRLDQTTSKKEYLNTSLKMLKTTLQISTNQSIKLGDPDLNQLKEFMGNERRIVDEKIEQIKKESDNFKNVNTYFGEKLNQIEKKRIGIEQTHTKKQIEGKISEILTNNHSFQLQTTFRQEIDEIWPNQAEPILDANSLTQFQNFLLVIEQERESDWSSGQ